MTEYILTIDLGTTLIKFGLFNSKLRNIANHSLRYDLTVNADFIEFDIEQYWNICKKGISEVLLKSKINSKKISSISLSSQAETLIVLDYEDKPLRKAISWMDNRSLEESKILKNNFDIYKGYKITGQADIITTWPITKMLWMRNNEKEIFNKAYKYLLLKDYIIYKFTGKFISEYTVYNSSYYFDIVKKRYWEDILKFVGIDIQKLPVLIEPGEIAGNLLTKISKELNFSSSIHLNVGALDQLAGMIGVGNIRKGIVSETTGTVIAICTVVDKPIFNKYKIPCYYNAVKNTYSLLSVCESGGICLEWFKNNFYENRNYKFIDNEIKKIGSGSDGLIFLPYIVGVNSPEYDTRVKGIFYGINIKHSKIHFTRAILEGVSYLIHKNIEYLKKSNIETNEIISLGGGSKSDIWNQINADITDKEVTVTKQNENSSLGAAILASISTNIFKNIEEAVKNTVEIKKKYYPNKKLIYSDGFRTFLDLYNMQKQFINKN